MSWYSAYSKISLTSFLETVKQENLYYAIKRLSGNDTNLTGGHQAGVYLPRWFFEVATPCICTTAAHNPKQTFSGIFFPNADFLATSVTATYYNSKHHPELGLRKKYDEFRLTNWGGADCPLQDKNNTGAIAVIVVKIDAEGTHGLAWVCTSQEEEALVEEWLGVEVAPGQFYRPQFGPGSRSNQSITSEIIGSHPEWLTEFPSGTCIFASVCEHVKTSHYAGDADRLLLRRREIELALFETLEERILQPQITGGFASVSKFLELSLSVANRRKSRTGASLELNLADIFQTNKLLFECQARTELKKKPDFLFPSAKLYHTPEFPREKLHMLAAKTCCKERWRQVISEADRITPKHLFTLQEGASEPQLREMYEANLVLVVPKRNLTSFPDTFRDKILHLQSFVDFIQNDQVAISALS